MITRLTLLLPVFVLAACTSGDAPAPASGTDSLEPNVAPELQAALSAHGGAAQWASMAGLTYSMDRGQGPELQQVDLWKRHIRWDGDGFTLGFDGDSAWVAPDRESFSGDPMFFSSLYFYFFAMPFVLADPGTIHADLGTRMINGEGYHAVQVTYDPGTGASPDDAYIAHFDLDTGHLRYLLYTVTFNSGEPSERFSALEYTEWQKADGLLVPAAMVGRRWYPAGDSIAGERYQVTFRDVAFQATPPPDSLFRVP